jgi:hypothetical protein
VDSDVEETRRQMAVRSDQGIEVNARLETQITANRSLTTDACMDSAAALLPDGQIVAAVQAGAL